VEYIKSISTLTDKDYAEIVSTFMTLTTPKYRCSDCNRKYQCDPVKDKKLKEQNACNFYTEKPRHKYTAGHNNKGNPGLNYFNCVGNHYYGEWATLINYNQDYSKGIMPFTGGFFEQPAKFVEVMNLVDNLIAENTEDIKKKNDLISRNRSGGKK